jgi:hypothetical protein
MLAVMIDPLAWIAAVGGVAATVGAWRTEATARWQARVERLRTDAARRENELHRRRFAEVWNWWHDQPDGPQRTEVARWYYEWTGARPPLSPGADGPPPPGIGCRDVDEAYERYVGYLGAVYEPGRLGPPRRRFSSRPRPLARRAEAPGGGGVQPGGGGVQQDMRNGVVTSPWGDGTGRGA